EQVDVVNEIAAPGAAGVLVEPHGPEGHDAGVGVGVELGKLLEAVRRHAGESRYVVDVVVADELGVFLETDRLGGPGGLAIGRLAFQLVLGPKAVADVHRAALEGRVPRDEVLVDAAGGDDVVGDVVEDGKV